jgi:tRNA A-37 threonylcarbamoyl transferase component Bud32
VQSGSAAPRPPPLFRWGNIEVREQVASGASADVYRAYECTLGIEVALKLHRDGPHSPTARRFLAEAQHLARVRQRNIVGVFGAAVHDERAGLWCEWIEGRSLAQTLEESGGFAPVEAAYIGIELCNALEALHGAGLLHGDLKPANVLRERGGRIVLVDLGAGGAPQSVNTATSDYGTPAYLSPEVLAGAQREPAHDLYALGRMLQTLLAGAADAPLPATTPQALLQVLARATAAEPGGRYATARQLHDALAGVLGGTGERAEPAPSALARRRRRLLIGAVLAAACAAVLAVVLGTRSPEPWRTEVELFRRGDNGVVALNDGAALAQGDRLVLDLDSNRALYAYILNEDAAGALHVLFPLPGLALANPLPAQHRVRLPGTQNGRELSWEISSDRQREEFLVVLAAAPVARLERAAQDAAVPVESAERGVGRVRAEPPAGIVLRGTQLSAILQDIAPLLADGDRVRVRAYRFNDAADVAP